MELKMTSKKFLPIAVLLLCVYLVILLPFTRYMNNRPHVEKLGLIPRPEVLKILFADYQELVGASILTKVLLYFGTLVETSKNPRALAFAADYPAMSRAVHTALQLDPYNADGYYFGQSILVWDAGQYRLATELLEYGMQHRTWDWQLPYFAGFNYVFFLKDKPSAAKMFMRAGELSGNSLFQTLAGRYLQESGHTQMAIDYLRTVGKNAKDPAIKDILHIRIEAFQAVLEIEQARDRYKAAWGEWPNNIAELISRGYMKKVPVDPYGGQLYLDSEKVVRSTSKFSFSGTIPGQPGDSSTSVNNENINNDATY